MEQRKRYFHGFCLTSSKVKKANDYAGWLWRITLYNLGSVGWRGH
jgi:hypothetical protein